MSQAQFFVSGKNANVQDKLNKAVQDYENYRSKKADLQRAANEKKTEIEILEREIKKLQDLKTERSDELFKLNKIINEIVPEWKISNDVDIIWENGKAYIVDKKTGYRGQQILGI